MKRFKYYIVPGINVVKRVKNRLVEHFDLSKKEWIESEFTFENVVGENTSFKQITRDEARKFRPAAFR